MPKIKVVSIELQSLLQQGKYVIGKKDKEGMFHTAHAFDDTDSLCTQWECMCERLGLDNVEEYEIFTPENISLF